MYLAGPLEFATTVYVESVVWSAGGGIGGMSGHAGTGGQAAGGGSGGSAGGGGAGGLGGGDACPSGSLGGQSGALSEGVFYPTGGGGAGGGSSCSCPSGLAIEVTGDGAPLSLASADVSSIVDSRSACLASSPPWAMDDSGEVSRLRLIQACAGPGGQGPCLSLDINGAICGSNSTYIDRAGNVIRGKATAITNWSWQTPLMGAVEGDYSIRLEDGRVLTGHLRVCLIARMTIA